MSTYNRVSTIMLPNMSLPFKSLVLLYFIVFFSFVSLSPVLSLNWNKHYTPYFVLVINLIMFSNHVPKFANTIDLNIIQLDLNHIHHYVQIQNHPVHVQEELQYPMVSFILFISYKQKN